MKHFFSPSIRNNRGSIQDRALRAGGMAEAGGRWTRRLKTNTVTLNRMERQTNYPTYLSSRRR